MALERRPAAGWRRRCAARNCARRARVERIAIAERTASGRARTLALAGGGESGADQRQFVPVRDGPRAGLEHGAQRPLRGRVLREAACSKDRGRGTAWDCASAAPTRWALAGRPYREILAFYYPGTASGSRRGGFAWQRLGGEADRAADHPAGSRSAHCWRAAERPGARVSREPLWRSPRDIEIRVYPDVETFRNATGEPGWVAAHTAGRRIHLQPAAVLRERGVLESTLRHELLHVVVESQAAAGAAPSGFAKAWWSFWSMPDESSVPADAGGLSDCDCGRPQDAARARRAYADAAPGGGSALVQRYGLALAVLGWLKTRASGRSRETASSSQRAHEEQVGHQQPRSRSSTISSGSRPA